MQPSTLAKPTHSLVTNFLHRQWLHSVPPHSPIILNNRSDGLVEINANLDLILRNIQVKNMGTYECVVVNHLGRQSLINNLAVIGKNSFVIIHLRHTTCNIVFLTISIQD